MKTTLHFLRRLTPARQATHLLLALLFTTLFAACNKDKDEPAPLAQPTIDNVEVGLNNNGIGLVGRDFHFNVDVVAGDKIEDVQIKIQQRAGETYPKTWSFERKWEQYRGAKNTNVHSHFTIPADAAEGKYDFLIIVHDQNGTRLEDKREIIIRDPANLPVDPKITGFVVGKVSGTLLYNMAEGGFFNPTTNTYGGVNTQQFVRNDNIRASMIVNGVKDSGKMYVLLINKKHNHRPESIGAIDFTKAIVLDAYEHTNVASIGNFFNYTSRRPKLPDLMVGAATDNNAPTPSPITGLKAWESGTYYLGVIYQNTTHNMGAFRYIEVPVEY